MNNTFYINLERRVQRRDACEALFRSAGLSRTKRIVAVDGNELYLTGSLEAECVLKGAVTTRSFGDESMQYGWVVGYRMTPGAAGLCATTLQLLTSGDIPADEPSLVIEDDAQVADGQEPSALRDLLALLAEGPDGEAARSCDWDMIMVGTNPETTMLDKVAKLPDHLGGALRKSGPFWGTFGYILRSRAAAERIAAAIFPCDVQLDSALAYASQQGRIHVLHLETALLTSPKSLPGNTDIQRMDIASFVAARREGARPCERPELLDLEAEEDYRVQFGPGSVDSERMKHIPGP